MPLTSGSVSKYHLGPPAQVYLNANTSLLDVGTSMGGCVFTYRPTYFDAVADQAIAPAKRWRTEERAEIKLSLPEISVQNLLIAMGYTPGSDTATAAGTLGTAGTATLTVNGTGAAVTYTYQIFVSDSNGDGIPATAVTTSLGPTTLGATNNITLNLPATPPGGTGIGIIRTVGGTTQGLIARLADNATSFTDTGIAATTYTPSAVQPNTPATDQFTFGGQIYVPSFQLDIAVPRNDGSGLYLRHRFWSVTADSETSIDYKRDKNSEISLTLACLANLGQATGAFFGKWLSEIPAGALG